MWVVSPSAGSTANGSEVSGSPALSSFGSFRSETKLRFQSWGASAALHGIGVVVDLVGVGVAVVVLVEAGAVGARARRR